MIKLKTENGEIDLEVQGTIVDIIADTSTILRSIYNSLGKEGADSASGIYKKYLCDRIESMFMNAEELVEEIKKLKNRNNVSDDLRRFYESE